MPDVRNPGPAPVEGPPPTPTWVKALIISGVLVAIAIVVILLTTSGHGPGRHGP